MGTLYHNSEKCKPYRRCKNFKICKTCNRIRQAHLADLTSMAGRFSPHSQYAVVMPYGEAQNHIKELKTKLTRKLRKSTNGTMVTVESSNNDALHLNIITNSDNRLTTAPFSKIISNMNFEASIFLDDLKTNTDIRRATAYSNKIESIPNRYQYNGNILNTTGNIRTMREVMQSQRIIEKMPVIAMVSINHTLTELGLEPLDEYLYNSNFIQKNLKQIMNYSDQLDKLGKCYSPKYGIMTHNEFKAKFNKRIGLEKARRTREKNKRFRQIPAPYFGLRNIDD